MPAHKRPLLFEVVEEEEDGDLLQRRDNHHEQNRQVDDDDEDDCAAGESDRRSSSSSDGTEKEEYIMVNLSEVRKEVQCPICLGIIRKTRTVMECLHRFCRECIDKSMRLGNNECPACRTHCASRRSLRDDPNYDALIAALYPDIDEYEEEELAFNEEEKARNKRIQATIAQTVKRQTEASSRKRSSKRAAADIVRKSRRGRTRRQTGLQFFDDNDDVGEDGERDSSSPDEQTYTEVKPKKKRRLGGARSCQPSRATSAERASDENGSEMNRESMGGTVAGLVGPSERLAWGRGGIRSHTRHGNGSGGNGKNSRAGRISKLVDYLRNLKENDDELVQLKLVPIDEQTIPNLQQPYLFCKPTLSVGQLCQYVALHTTSQADEIEICLVKDLQSKLNPSSSIDPSKEKLKVLNKEDSLAGLQLYFDHGYVLLGYQRKLGNGNR